MIQVTINQLNNIDSNKLQLDTFVYFECLMKYKIKAYANQYNLCFFKKKKLY